MNIPITHLTVRAAQGKLRGGSSEESESQDTKSLFHYVKSTAKGMAIALSWVVATTAAVALLLGAALLVTKILGAKVILITLFVASLLCLGWLLLLMCYEIGKD